MTRGYPKLKSAQNPRISQKSAESMFNLTARISNLNLAAIFQYVLDQQGDVQSANHPTSPSNSTKFELNYTISTAFWPWAAPENLRNRKLSGTKFDQIFFLLDGQVWDEKSHHGIEGLVAPRTKQKKHSFCMFLCPFFWIYVSWDPSSCRIQKSIPTFVFLIETPDIGPGCPTFWMRQRRKSHLIQLKKVLKPFKSTKCIQMSCGLNCSKPINSLIRQQFGPFFEPSLGPARLATRRDATTAPCSTMAVAAASKFSRSARIKPRCRGTGEAPRGGTLRVKQKNWHWNKIIIFSFGLKESDIWETSNIRVQRWHDLNQTHQCTLWSAEFGLIYTCRVYNQPDSNLELIPKLMSSTW